MFEILKKELRELSRDTRALIFMILLPILLIPVLSGGFAYLAGNIARQDQQQSLKYAIVGAQYDQALANRLRTDKQFSLVQLPAGMKYKDAIDQRLVRFVLEIPKQAAAELSSGRTVSVDMIFNDASETNSAFQRVQKVADAVGAELQSERLMSRGYRSDEMAGVTQPVSIRKISTASPREVLGEQLGSLVPFLLITVCGLGVIFPAIDLGVGEKERGTLETLLLTPVPRHSIVLAKFLVLLATGWLAAFLAIASAVAWILLVMPAMAKDAGSMEMLHTMSAISVMDVSMILLMLVPVAAMFAAVSLSVSIYARGFKEANSYMNALVLTPAFPLMLAMLPGVNLSWGWAAVPVTNVALAIKEICKGTIDYSKLLVIFGSSALIAGLCILVCTWWFKRESVLFRS